MTIVTGVDGSASAFRAAQAAARLAEAFGEDLVVVSAYGKLEIDSVTSGSEEFILSSAKDASTTASQVVEILRTEFPSLMIISKASDGKPADALVKVAERSDARAIVVGNRRVQGLSRVLGSIARDVLAHAPCDVYVAHSARP